MKFFAAIILAVGLLVADSAEAQRYQGGWSFAPGGQGRAERLWLGDGNTYGLHLSGTSRFCGQPGASYARMRQVLRGTRGFSPDYITWWIANTCRDGYVRVCLRNQRGAQACSTYGNRGWGGRP